MLNTNPQEQFEELKAQLIKQVTDTFPIQDTKGRFEVRVKDLTVLDNRGVDDIRGQLKARLKGQTWAAPVMATIEIVDDKGKVLLSKPKTRLAEIPKLTRHYSYIIDGKEKMIANQWRLRPGAYVKETEREGEYEAQFQLSKGKNFDIKMDPGSGYMFVAMGARKIPLYSVLSASGISDDQMKKAWGDRNFEANLKKAKVDKDLASFHVASGKGKPEEGADLKLELQKYFAGTEMDPKVTKDTLGKGFAQVSEESLFVASKKLLGVSAGKIDPDPIDALQFKELWTAKDHFSERIASAHNDIHTRVRKSLGKPKVQAAILAGDHSAIRDVVMPDLIQKPMTHVFATALAANSNQINPVSMLADKSHVTIMGPGGITNEHIVSSGNTALDPSQLGFVDPVFTPESAPGTSLHLSAGTTIKDRKPYTKLYNLKTGKIEQVSPDVAARKTVVFPDQIKWKGGKPLPLQAMVRVSDHRGNIRDLPFKEADYTLIAPSQVFSVETNLVPFMQNDSAGRTTMSARHMAQAISLVGRQAPMVQVESAPGSTFEKEVAGRFLSHRALTDGVVAEINKDHIVIKGAGGKKHEVDLYDHYPLNDKKAMLHSFPTVKVGDKVKKNQMLADNNFSKDGQLALGTNLRVAYLANGTNHEDGVVLSERAAGRLGSKHLYKPSLMTSMDTVIDREKFRAHKPNAFKKGQLKGMGENGVIKPGTIVHPGDPLILALNPETNPDSIDVKIMRRLSKKTRLDYSNSSLVWGGEHSGEVVRVSKKGKSWVVHVKTQEPTVVGSKVSTRHSAKGVVAQILPDAEMPRDRKGKNVEMLINPVCYDKETEFLTRRGWIRGEDMAEGDTFATMNPETFYIEWQKASEIIKQPYRGKMYRIKNRQIDLLVTPNHRMFTARRVKGPEGTLGSLDFESIDSRHWTDETAEEIFGQPRRYLKAGRWAGYDPGVFVVPQGSKVSSGRGPDPKEGWSIPTVLWVEFMGWFLSEGYTHFNKASYGYIVGISQSVEANPEKYAQIQELLESMELPYSATPAGFVTRHKGLYELLKPFGGANEKYIPREILDLPPKHLSLFLDTFIAGDGNVRWEPDRGHYGTRRLSSNSKALVDGLQEICIKLGYAANIKEDPRVERYSTGHHYTMSLGPSGKAPWINWCEEYKITQIEEWVDYDGLVYCCTVPNAMVLVRRNGVHIVAGNSVPGRQNPGQILETVAGKIAEKTGKPYVVKNFDGNTDYLKKLKGELKKHGIPETETLFDPKTGRKLGDVTVGPHYAFQLVHQIDKKTHVRHGGFYVKGLAPHIRYDQNKVPRGGGEGGAQSLGALGIYGALASGLKDNLREMQTHKSDQPQAEAVWDALKNGELVPPPQVPFVYKKFEAQMKSVGLNLEKQGNHLRLLPTSDEEVLALSRGEVTRPDLAVIAKNVKPEKGGIFDTRIFGGQNGKHWGHIQLAEPMPNPIFAKPIAQLIGIKPDEIDQIVAGKKTLGKFGTGPKAIHKALKAIKVTEKMAEVKKQLDDPKVKAAQLNSVNAVHKTLVMLKDTKKSPSKAFMVKNLPVMPPLFRPFTTSPDRTDRIDPMNNLYRRLGQVNVSLRDSDKAGVPYELTMKNRGDLYSEMQNLFGTTAKGKKAFDIDVRGSREIKDRALPGVLHTIAGASPKDGFFQDKLVGKKQDYTARATIVADPTLGPDEVGVPRKIAIEMFRPFVTRRLVRSGLTPLEAQEHIQKRSTRAIESLEKVVDNHPVLLKRDPVLHAYGLVGQNVKLIKSKAIKVSPLILPPINGDIDGDQVALLLPLSEKAKEEVRKIMPSQRPLSDASGDVLFQPANESMLGLYRSTLKGRGKITSKRFLTLRKAEEAFKQNRIDLNDTITIGKDRTTIGRARISQIVPTKYKQEILLGTKPFGKKKMHEVLKYTAVQKPKHFAEVASGLSQLGFQMAYESGHSVTLNDLEPLRDVRKRIVDKAKREVAKLKGPGAGAKATATYIDATRKIHAAYDAHYEKHPTNISDMAKGGIKAKKPQFQGLVMAPMLVQDHRGRPSKVPVTRSFAEGIGVGDYWLQSQGARRGVIQKVDGISEPGYWTKMMVQVNIDQPVSGKDCGTKQGLMMPITNRDVVDRHLASPIKLGGRVLLAGTAITPDIHRAMGKAKMKSVAVRSPLKCRMPHGVCGVCMGRHPSGHHYQMGENVGLVAAQSLGERSAQLMLRQTHGGGLVTTDQGAVDQFNTVKDLFAMQKKRNPNQAPIAGRDGTVKRVEPQKQGGWAIYTSISKRPFYSRQRPMPSIKPGYRFKKGEKLTHGDPNPHDLLKARGVTAVQDHMVKRIGGIYGGEGIKQRHVELVVRNSTNMVRIDDPGDHSSIVRGDYMQRTVMEEINRNTLQGKKPIRGRTMLKNISEIPGHRQKDWMARLMTKNLGAVVMTAAQQGQRSRLHGPHPIPGLAYGAEFGKGTGPSKY